MSNWAVKLIDGLGSKRRVKVTTDHALLVSHVLGDLPEVGTASRLRYFQEDMYVVGGTSTALNVNGSVTPVTFEYKAQIDYDIHIQSIVILIADFAISPNKFGDIAALTNGFTLAVTELGQTTNLLTSIKTGGEMAARSGGRWMFSALNASINEISNWTGNTDAFAVVLPIGDYVDGGLRLGRQTTDRIFATVNDNLTGLNEMRVSLFGQRAYPS